MIICRISCCFLSLFRARVYRAHENYYYQTLFEGELLWVKNKDYINLLIDFLGAKHRIRPYNGLYNFLTRLPGWIVKADKEKIVRALQKLLEM